MATKSPARIKYEARRAALVLQKRAKKYGVSPDGLPEHVAARVNAAIARELERRQEEKEKQKKASFSKKRKKVAEVMAATAKSKDLHVVDGYRRQLAQELPGSTMDSGFQHGVGRAQRGGLTEVAAKTVTKREKVVAETLNEVFEMVGGVEAYAEWAKINRDKFYEQWIKQLPLQIKASIHVAGEFVNKLEEGRARLAAVRKPEVIEDGVVVDEIPVSVSGRG